MLPLLDLKRQHAALHDELCGAFARVLNSGHFILGQEVDDLERSLAEYIGTRYALGVSSGTDALVIALQAAGVGPGDEVITTPFSFFASVGAILRVGAIPRFADIEAGGFNLDPARVEAALTKRTRAVLCVHLFGDPARVPELRELCDAHGLILIEDAAQALSAEIDGQRIGSFGHLACFSFFPSKPLGGLGDGGLLTTSDPTLFDRCRLLRAHGAARPHEHELLGGNHRLDALQAALLQVKLPHVSTWRDAREHHAARYDAAFAGAGDVALRELQPRHRSAHAHYTLRLLGRAADRRQQIVQQLLHNGIQSAIYYQRPIYAQPVPELKACLSGREQLDCPQAEARCREVLTLPLFPELSQTEHERVVAALLESLA